MKTFPVLVVILSASLQLCGSVELCSLNNPPFIRIPENVTVGTVVGRFDITGNENQVVLEQSTGSSKYFSVNTTSRVITLAAPLDYEIHWQESLYVVVTCSQENPTLSATLSLAVALTDVNDNSPIFSSDQYTANVSESAKVNSIIYSGITATDGDKTNLYMQYDVVPGPYSSYLDFERASKGEVTLKKRLDYETIQSFTVQIKALDTPSDTNSPRRSAITNLTILVQNEDDMDPAFSRDHYETEIDSSTEAGGVIRTSPPIFAEDQDLIQKSALVYSLWDYSDAFKIDNRTGVVTLRRQLSGGSYTAILKAEQADNPARRAVATLTVVVLGSGTTGTYNRRPRFLKKTYDVTVFENTPIQQSLISVPAVDADVKDTLSYRLADDKEGTFAITNTADIVLLKALDYESVEQFSLLVTVTDGSATATATVVIRVSDVNDNNPEIAEPNIFVKTERQPNSLIAKIQASDKDRFSKLSYSLVSNEKRFSVNDKGELYMTGLAEDFPGTEYSVVILVQDNGDPPRQATARVQINLPEINATGVPTTGAIMEEPSDALAIVLGIVAAILLFVVIVLAILLIRSKKREGNSDEQIETPNPARRAFQDENLEKVKPPSHLDPEGLAYRPNARPQPTLFPTSVDLNRSDHGETEDGATTIQENPITGINHGYSGSDVSEAGHDLGDIRIQTSMTPYDNNNGYPGFVENDMFGAGDLKTFHHNASSNESLSSDSTPGSKKQLVKPDLMEHGKPNSRPPFSWNNLNGSTVADSNGDIPIDGRRSADDKPEITVYF